MLVTLFGVFAGKLPLRAGLPKRTVQGPLAKWLAVPSGVIVGLCLSPNSPQKGEKSSGNVGSKQIPPKQLSDFLRVYVSHPEAKLFQISYRLAPPQTYAPNRVGTLDRKASGLQKNRLATPGSCQPGQCETTAGSCSIGNQAQAPRRAKATFLPPSDIPARLSGRRWISIPYWRSMAKSNDFSSAAAPVFVG